METNDQSLSEVESTDRMLEFLGGEDEEEQQVETQEAEPEEQPEEETEEVEPEAAEPEFIELVVNGEQLKKSKDEVVELAQKGLDYTQKTQLLAEERRRAQAEINARLEEFKLREAVIDKVAEAKAIESQLQQFSLIDWNALVDSDPVQAMKLDRQYRNLQETYNRTVGDINTASQQARQHQEDLKKESFQREGQSLLNVIPEWKDAAKRDSERVLVKSTLQQAGFSAEEIETLADHRQVVIARKAMLYDQLMAKKPELTKKVAEAPKPVKPGTSQQRNPKGSDYSKARESLKKTGRQEYAQSAIERLL